MSAPTRKTSNSRKVRRIGSTELSKHLASVLTRVRDRNETVIVERNGKPLCMVSPIEESRAFTMRDLAKLLASLPPAGKEWADAVAEHIANQETFKAPKWNR